MPPNDSQIRAHDFVMGAVSVSKKFKSQFIDKWQEVLANHVVEPLGYATHSVREPYSRAHRGTGYSMGGSSNLGGHRNIVLKDGETHKAVMTWAASIVLTILGDPRGEYVRASPVGWEDAPGRAPTATKLMKYVFGLPCNYRAMVEAVTDMILFGTAIIEIPWKFVQREQIVRAVQTDPFTGFEQDVMTRQMVTTFDDVALDVIDNQHFYPDPGEHLLENMSGVTKGGKMNAHKARLLKAIPGYDSDAIERAIQLGKRISSGTQRDGDDQSLHENFREGYDQPYDRRQHGDFIPMPFFEYWGDVPWVDDGKSSRRVITLLNGEVIRDIDYPLADGDLPFRSLTINPVKGRFYGISPAEVIRWDQDLQDAMKILLAEAVIRQVHPPIAFDSSVDIDEASLRHWSPDQPVPIQGGPSGVGTLRYDANVFNGFAQAERGKQAMQETSGAVSALQGQEGPNREAATVGALRFQQAGSRPALVQSLLERSDMPLIAKSILRRYQQFESSEGLALKVGQLPDPVWLGDIMGDFDIMFVGSQMAMSRQERLQSLDRLNTLSATNPVVQALTPWQAYLTELIGRDLELPEVAVLIGDPATVEQNLRLAGILGPTQGSGNANGTFPTPEPAGLAPAQAGGGPVAPQ